MSLSLFAKRMFVVLVHGSTVLALCMAAHASDSATTIPAAGWPVPSSSPASRPAVGEKVPSDDPAIWDFHSLGLVNGRQNIFRSASPLRDFVKKGDKAPDDPAVLAEAAVRMKRLRGLGIRTIISFEDPRPRGGAKDDAKGDGDRPDWIAREKNAATDAGIAFVSLPIANSGTNSLQTMSDGEVLKLLDSVTDEVFKRAGDGGVVFHCAAGHDRAGIVTAFIRLKHQRWPVDQAIDEMRRYGHNWPKFSSNGGVSSWHEDHLRAIAELLKERTPDRTSRPAGGS